MRRWKLIAALSGASVGALLACGPSSDEICDFSGTCESPLADASDTGIPDQTTDVDAYVPPDSSDGGGDEDVHVPPDAGPCDLIKEPYDGCQPNDQSGIFVSADASVPDSGALGTRQSPYNRIGDAIKALSSGEPNKPGRIYVCQGDYAETVTIDNKLAEDVKIFGSLNCGTWAWVSGANVRVKPAKPGHALDIVANAKVVQIEDVYFESPTATGYEANGAGTSSIAAFVTNGAADVIFTRAVLKSGAGIAGQAGPAIADWSPASAPAGNQGSNGAAGGAQPASTFTCPNGSGQTQGANGGAVSGGGGTGFPGSLPEYPMGATGVGTTYAECKGGQNGKNGSYGPGGTTDAGTTGTGASVAGALTATGWLPANGLTGGIGKAAQGGGGGGGGDTGGGGGGGQGGCGGSGGNAGTGAGASIALLIYRSTVKLNGCTLSVSPSLNGGAGGKGQNGQSGGARGAAIGADGCAGGAGGVGGSGGGGGGGAGGTSVAIGYFGTPPTIDGTSTADSTGPVGGVTGGTAGGGGAAGLAGDAGAGPGLVGDNGTSGIGGIGGAVKALPGS